MRQNRTVIASSREARVGVCCGWVIRGSFRQGVGWPPFYLILNPRNTHLVVQREEFPYRYVTVEGTVIGEDRPPSAEQVLVVVRRYLPEEQAQWFVESELRRPSQ